MFDKTEITSLRIMHNVPMRIIIIVVIYKNQFIIVSYSFHILEILSLEIYPTEHDVLEYFVLRLFSHTEVFENKVKWSVGYNIKFC